RDATVTGVQTCALPISGLSRHQWGRVDGRGARSGRSATGPSQIGEAAWPIGWQEEAYGQRYLFVALRRPAPARRVFRPARRVSWGTWIFVILVLLIAVGALGGFIAFLVTQRFESLVRRLGGCGRLAREAY